MRRINRKEFLRNISLVTLGFTSFSKLIASKTILDIINSKSNLIEDSKGILNLPDGFVYKIISKYKDKMDDGLHVPNNADGMASFKGSKDNIILIRNHELGHFPLLENKFISKNPYGKGFQKYMKNNYNKFYDSKNGKTECFGCTTTIVYNSVKQKVVKQYLSLAGTLVNCSGGPSPWNTWVSCEETTKRNIGKLIKDHGYNFEVFPNERINLSTPAPLKDMGRFRHEAVSFDPQRGFVYQTEDREDGLFYRFIPKINGQLSRGGKLQGLSIKGYRGYDCTNWNNTKINIKDKFNIKWIDLNNVESPKDDLRIRGRNKGCAIFARGEGMWFADDFVYFTSTTGGKQKLGQIWRYKHSEKNDNEGVLELFFESSNKDKLNMPDNITVTPWGDLLISEDCKDFDRLMIVNSNLECFVFAENILNKSEFAGANFSPDGKILFVNIYKPAMTLAITGPWNNLKKLPNIF